MVKKLISMILTLAMCLTICPMVQAATTVNIDLSAGYIGYSNSEGPNEEDKWGSYWVNFSPTYTSTPTTIQINPGRARISSNFYHEGWNAVKEYHDCTYYIAGKPTGGLKSFTNPYSERPWDGPCSLFTDITPSVVTGLTPNTRYEITASFPCTKSARDNDFGAVDTFIRDYGYAKYVWTAAAIPIISFSNIKDKQLTINWNPNGNPSGTIYNIERKIGNGPWSTILSNYTGNTYTDTNLVEDTTYIYRVKVLHVAPIGWDGGYGTSDAIWDVYTPEQTVTTTANPAVAAAQEAASAAQAAKLAADSSLQNTQEAKSAAVNVYDQVNNADYGLQALNTKIENLKSSVAPVIAKASGINGATCTRNGGFTIVIQASGADQFRAGLDTNDISSNWDASNVITLTNISPGIHTIFYEAKNSNGAITKGALSVFSM